MKIIKRIGEMFIVEMTASEIDCLVENFFDVDRTGVLLDGEELGNLLLENGVEINNFYVPAGGDVPDPLTNDKFAHKLDFLGEMTNWFAARKAPDNKLVLVGDLNVAPLENDVWSHKALLKVVSHTPVEVEAMTALMAAGDWIDAMRRFVPPEEHLYSWWSYRARDWDDADKGRRLDHVWVTPALDDALESIAVSFDEKAAGIWLGSCSLAAGILNAAAMTP